MVVMPSLLLAYNIEQHEKYVAAGVTSCCMFENTPQPIDSLLLGSWIQTLESEIGYTIVAFSGNNGCVVNKYSNGDNASESRNWYVNGNILAL